MSLEPESVELLPQILRMLIALITVVALMGGLAMIIRKLGLAGAISSAASKASRSKQQSDKRLQLLEVLPLDPRRQIAIIKCDDQEHLIILGVNGESVIDTNIQDKPQKAETNKDKTA